MATTFDVINQACKTEYELNNAFIHDKFDYPIVCRRIDDQSVEFTLFFKTNIALKKEFCADLVSHHLAYSEEGDNAIILQATEAQIPAFLRSLNLVAKNRRNPSSEFVFENLNTLFMSQSRNSVMSHVSSQHRAF